MSRTAVKGNESSPAIAPSLSPLAREVTPTSAVEDLARVPHHLQKAFALDRSILQDPQYSEKQEYNLAPYRNWRVAMMVLGSFLALINKGYVFFLWCLQLWWKKSNQLTKEREKTIKNKEWLGVPGLCSGLDNSDRHLERLRMGVTTFVALDVLYAKQIILPSPPRWGKGRLAWLIITSPEPQAVTNRLKITAQRIRGELEKLHKAGKREINFAALASGSAQAVIEVLAEFTAKYPEVQVRLSLVDTNPEALAMARALAAARGLNLPDETFRQMHLLKFLSKCDADSFDLVEMVGFLDYRTESSLKRLCGEIRRVLKPGALFITAHIAPSKWAFVVRWVINWPGLVRRPPQVFRSLLVQSGFRSEKIELEVERHNIHAVALCRKEG